MKLRSMLGKVFILGVLEVGALCGVPIRPEQIEQVMKLSESAIVVVVRNDDLEPKDRKL